LLIGARYYRCMQDSFAFGAPLSVFVQIAMRDADDFAAYDCHIELAGRRVAECTLKAYRPRDLSAVLGDAARG
jgi:predicted hotdog family 3-hydroxylacyl-ACP dehydratase